MRCTPGPRKTNCPNDSKKDFRIAAEVLFAMQKHSKIKKCAISSPLRGNRK